MKRIFLIGLGLIGGSLALGIRRGNENVHIVGYDLDENQARLGLSLGVIDEYVYELSDGVNEADFIIIATPVEQTLLIIDQIKEMPLKKGVIISDVGSTKEKVVNYAANNFGKDVIFIGGHPMAGSHKSGVSAAKSHLFENAFYILTPLTSTPTEAISSLKTLLNGTKANFIEILANEHDGLTSVISHFPHIIAASLVHQADKYEKEHPLVKRLAAGGFRDITRIASSSPAMWRDILLQNKHQLLTLFDKWIKEMVDMKETLASENGEEIYNYFSKAKQFRDELPVKEKGAIPSFYDLYVDVPDYPGVISEITGYLAVEKISLTNIRIMETREDIYGVLRISFQSEKDREKAKLCIEHYTNYHTFYS